MDRGHQGGFIMFKPIIQKLLSFESCNLESNKFKIQNYNEVQMLYWTESLP